ncbi:MAG TPA: glycosyltransferase family 2 protein [Bacteroidales bacterium]|nr:glycosyltransferase family 2 protein [Bacteroidales bacterium]
MKLKISIITPCYNIEGYIRQTIESVLNQGYENLEYIIIDGGSTDKTPDIISEYKDNISVMISEKDRGQYYAINKGLSLATGDIIGWLNADDIYFPWTLETVNNIFRNSRISWISGIPAFIDSRGLVTNIYNQVAAKPSGYIRKGLFRKGAFGYLQQESMFWRRNITDECGFLNTDYKLAADYELWKRFSQKYELYSVALPLAAFRKRTNNHSIVCCDKYEKEVEEICSNNKTADFLFRIAGRNNKKLSRIIRLLIWSKAPVVYYSVSKEAWCVEKRYRPISNISLSNLLLEI